jgi:hypothetical protein
VTRPSRLAPWSGYDAAYAQDPSGVMRVLQVATWQRFSRRELAWVIEHESYWRPDATNMATGATGLIQFMPDTARKLGTSVDDLRAMTRAQQTGYIRKFYAPHAGRIRRPGDVYLATFYPAALGWDDSAVIFAVGTKGWEQNRSLREGWHQGMKSDEGGPITAGSVRARGIPPAGGGPSELAEEHRDAPPTGDRRGGQVFAVLLLGAAILYDRKQGRRKRRA